MPSATLQKRDDDLFKDTTMTFGEHLEELRGSLFKAVIALVIGFCIGLIIGGWVVRRIQDPLQNALKDYYLEQAVEDLQEEIALRKANGERIPPELEDEELLRNMVIEQGLLCSEVYVDPDELAAAVNRQRANPQQAKPPETNPPKANPSHGDRPQAKKSPAAKSGSKKESPAAGSVGIDRDKMARILIWRPVEEDERLRLKSLSVQETFMIYLKAAFVSGAVISSPFVFYYIWSFVAAGLYPHEKRYVHLFLPFSLGLFLFGAALAFFFVFPPVLSFFFGYNRMFDIDPDPRISEWLSFVLLLPLGFGISFQLPLVMLFLERIGVFEVRDYIQKWRIAILVMAVAAMVLSPGGDPNSMLMMLGPLILLYFGGIALCKWMPAHHRRA